MSEVKVVLSRNGKKKGKVTSSGHRCRMHGCTGKRLSVKWEDGKRTYPCTKGLKYLSDDTAQID